MIKYKIIDLDLSTIDEQNEELGLINLMDFINRSNMWLKMKLIMAEKG
jgi:hypothetical protein